MAVSFSLCCFLAIGRPSPSAHRPPPCLQRATCQLRAAVQCLNPLLIPPGRTVAGGIASLTVLSLLFDLYSPHLELSLWVNGRDN